MQAIRAQRDAQGGAVVQDGVWGFQGGQVGAGLEDAGAQGHVLRHPLGHEGGVVVSTGVAAAHHLDPDGDVAGGADLDRQAKAVKELGAEFAFFGVAGADEDKAGGVADRQALTLYHVLARLGDIEEEVDDVIFKQVDLVDMKVAAFAMLDGVAGVLMAPYLLWVTIAGALNLTVWRMYPEAGAL